MSEVEVPAAWYPDPDGRGGMRYWSGTAWTEHRQPPTPSKPARLSPMPPQRTAAPHMPTRVSGWSRRKKIALTLLAAALALVAVGASAALAARRAHPAIESTFGYMYGYSEGVQLAQAGQLSAERSCKEDGEVYLLRTNRFVPANFLAGCLAGFKATAPPGLG